MTSGPLAGAVMMTFFAPAARCFAASSRLVNLPVDSKTTSTPERLPRQLGRVLHRQDLERVAVHADRAVAGRDVGLEVPEHRVVLQQVRERVGVREVVDRDEVDVVVAERRPQDVPADATEAVDADLDCHELPSSRYAVRRHL